MLASCITSQVHGSLHPYTEIRIWEQYPILSLESIQRICNKCVALKEINLRKTELSEDSVNFLVNNLTTTVEKLNLEELKCLKDEYIQTLVKRCSRITSLDLRRTGYFQSELIFNYPSENLMTDCSGVWGSNSHLGRSKFLPFFFSYLNFLLIIE